MTVCCIDRGGRHYQLDIDAWELPARLVLPVAPRAAWQYAPPVKDAEPVKCAVFVRTAERGQPIYRQAWPYEDLR